MRKQQFATSLPARENPFQLNPTESNCTQRTNLHHFPHTPTETKQKNRSWVSLKHSQLYKITICFFLTIPYTFYHPNQPNKSAPKKTTDQHSDGNAEHPQGASPSISPAPAPKPPGDMAFGFVAEEFLGESVIDAILLWWQAYIPGMIDKSIQRLLDKTLNLIASHPWVGIKKETMFQSRPWKKVVVCGYHTKIMIHDRKEL